ncbi:hypothetical protein DTO027B5_6492 [Paecilomyces variotii]|nr:hypothetical protein DTO169C6_2547 [Paecilomyces variotii]KAJ9281108.1 hypothetical protein DTO021D3_2162 [Paecilomyces variotii]KAJ9291621.1 hypothetical protein DTO021C3_978 [Paecilomyces variotii]KAJ9307367.1 hypothetical protein DTO217A2_3049 [Paecilomyces variotii]KAJ9331672.1 hypothetical protein DTO027B5_6492 [Paecilomyces variotii]
MVRLMAGTERDIIERKGEKIDAERELAVDAARTGLRNRRTSLRNDTCDGQTVMVSVDAAAVSLEEASEGWDIAWWSLLGPLQGRTLVTSGVADSLGAEMT